MGGKIKPTKKKEGTNKFINFQYIYKKKKENKEQQPDHQPTNHTHFDNSTKKKDTNTIYLSIYLSATMCRMVVFNGKCIRCGTYYTIPELEQRVSCLEAKNNGGFGDCHKGINLDEHDPAFECMACSSALGIMDGNGGDELIAAAGSGTISTTTTTTTGTNGSGKGKGKGSSGGGGSGGGNYDTTKRRRVR